MASPFFSLPDMATGDTDKELLYTTHRDLLERLSAGRLAVAMADANQTLTTSPDSTRQDTYAIYDCTGSLTAQRNLTVPATPQRVFVVRNSTTGGFGILVKTAGSGIVVPPGHERILRSDGTNVVDVFAPAAAVVARWHKEITKTNVNTTYVDVYTPGANGERQPVNFDGYRAFRVIAHWNNVGGSEQFVQILETAGSNVLTQLSDGSGAGEKEVDSGWINLPSWATGDKFLKPQIKASNATDDPVFRGATVLLR
jgi:hypothetical protein